MESLQRGIHVMPKKNLPQLLEFLKIHVITYQIEEKEYMDNGKYQAIDLGISNIISAVNLHSKFIQIKNRRSDLYWKKKLKEVQSKRDHCKIYSKKWKRYNQKLCAMKRKCANQMKDF